MDSDPNFADMSQRERDAARQAAMIDGHDFDGDENIDDDHDGEMLPMSQMFNVPQSRQPNNLMPDGNGKRQMTREEQQEYNKRLYSGVEVDNSNSNQHQIYQQQQQLTREQQIALNQHLDRQALLGNDQNQNQIQEKQLTRDEQKALNERLLNAPMIFDDEDTSIQNSNLTREQQKQLNERMDNPATYINNKYEEQKVSELEAGFNVQNALRPNLQRSGTVINAKPKPIEKEKTSFWRRPIERRGTVNVTKNDGKKLLASELTKEDKAYIIDVAKPDPDKPPPNDLDYKSEYAELIMEHLLVIAHDSDSSNLRQIMMTAEVEKFIERGHTKVKLIDGIMQAYKKIYVTKKRAAIMLAANLETVDHLIYSCSFSDKKGGDIMLLALIFYMGIDSKGSKIVEQAKAEKEQLVKINLNDKRWQDEDIQNQLDEIGDMVDSVPDMKDGRVVKKEKKEFQTTGSKASMNQLLQGQEEIQWWLSRAISYIKPHFGEVIRYAQISQASQVNYYQPGKVFQWVNFVTANTLDYKPTDEDKKKNVVFYIISQTGRPMSHVSKGYTVKNKQVIKQDYLNSNDVIFDMGTEFLCCKSEYRNKQQHIYLREIRSGFSTNSVLWIDDEIIPSEAAAARGENSTILSQMMQSCYQKNVSFILKSSSKTAWAYINSDFFTRGLEACFSFKIVTDVTRTNEEGGQEAQWNAGPRFIKKFLDEKKDVVNIDKVEFMVFCRDKKGALQKMRNAGIPEDQTPHITTGGEGFSNYVEKNNNNRHNLLNRQPTLQSARVRRSTTVVDNTPLPSMNRKDYENDEERLQGYNKALAKYKGEYGDFQEKYGHLLDDDDDDLPGSSTKNIGQIQGMIKEIGKENIEQLMALADDDDDIDDFINQMKEEKMYEEPIKDEPVVQEQSTGMKVMYEKPSYQRIIDAEREKIMNSGKIYTGPSDSVLDQCGIPLNKKRYIEKERNQLMFGGHKYMGPSAQLLSEIEKMTDDSFRTLFTIPNMTQRQIDQARNEALNSGKPDPYPFAGASLDPRLNNLAKPEPKKVVDPSTMPKYREYDMERHWDQDFNAWFNNGMPDDDNIPGNHPIPGHEWNTNRQGMIDRLNQGGTEPEEY